MTFAAAERNYLTPPEPCCDDDDCDGDQCRERDAQAKWDADSERGDARRKGDEYA